MSGPANMTAFTARKTHLVLHLHDLMEVLHVLSGHPLHVLPAETVLHQQLVELLDLVTGCKCSRQRHSWDQLGQKRPRGELSGTNGANHEA